MNTSVLMRAGAVLLAWLGIMLGAGYFVRQGIASTFGPDTWWMVAGWVGMVLGLIHFLAVLILARQSPIEQ